MSNAYPEHILQILRMRIGERDDAFNHDLDEECNAMSKRRVMQELIAWEFGDSYWYDWFESRLDSVGLKITEKKQ